jgi:hypothetical protein
MPGMSKKSVKPGTEAATGEGEAADEGAAEPADHEARYDHLPAPPPPPPSIGRIVLYTSAGEKGFVGQVFAAVITAVDAETVSLRVWTPTADFVVPGARFTDAEAGSVGPDEAGAQGRWSWPRRV